MKYSLLGLSLLLSACTSSDNAEQSAQINKSNAYVEEEPVLTGSEKYYADELIKNVNHYAKWLTQDLFGNLDFPDNNDIFVVTNFALLDSDLNKTSHFGRQMAEAMIHEVHKTGFSVIDLKATGFIRMTDKGDAFYQSTDFLELSPATDATHVITGTLTKHQGGYIVNAKAILLINKSIVSSARIFVPHEVVDAVMLETKEVKSKKTTMPLKAYTK